MLAVVLTYIVAYGAIDLIYIYIFFLLYMVI